jgi:ABC-type polar amino acid transport system ATPase subunit
VMKELAELGMTMVIATHELPFAEEVSDWVVFIDGGRIIEEGPARAVLRNPQNPRTREYVRSYESSAHDHE